MPLANELSELRGDIKDLIERQTRTEANLNALAEDVRDEREVARDQRDALTQVISALSGAVKTLADRVNTISDVKPIVDAIVIKQHKEEGVREYRRKQWALLTGIVAVVTGFVGWLFEWWPKLGGLFKGVPPSPS